MSLRTASVFVRHHLYPLLRERVGPEFIECMRAAFIDFFGRSRFFVHESAVGNWCPFEVMEIVSEHKNKDPIFVVCSKSVANDAGLEDVLGTVGYEVGIYKVGADGKCFISSH